MSAATWRASRAYSRFAHPAGLDEWLLSVSKERAGELRVFATLRRQGETPFSVRERGMLHQFFAECQARFGSVLSEREAVSVDNLPPRMRDVLIGLLDGKSEKQVAKHLGISPNTVHCYTKQLYERFGAACRGELLATCRRHASIIAAYTKADESSVRSSIR